MNQLASPSSSALGTAVAPIGKAADIVSRLVVLRRWATVVLPVLFVAFALWMLHHELRNYRLHDILAEMSAIPKGRVALAAAATLIAYLVLAGYDWLGFRYIHHPLPLRRIASAAFISYALSYNLGHTLITGGSVRYRLYSAWGLSTQNIAKVVAFCVLTFWVGVIVIAGVAFLVEPETISLSLHLPLATIRPIGVLLLGSVASYLLWTAFRKAPLKVRSISFEVPSLRISIAQIIVTALDLVLAGTVLYILLPNSLGLSYTAVIGIYLIAITIGLVSQVPGGLGVFETAFLHLLPTSASSTAVAGALLAYRGVYYLFPLIVAALMFAGHEVENRFKKVPEARAAAVRWFSAIGPHALAAFTFVSGAVLLFSGAVPGVGPRLDALSRHFPLPVLEVSHLLGSVVGAGLLVLARGIQRRLDGAYWLTVLLLSVGILASLLKGFDYEEAILLALVLAAVLPCRRRFYRRAALLREPFSAGWLAAVGIVIVCTLWIGLFSFKHVDYRSDLWWQFAIMADAPRFMRAALTVAILLLVVAFRRLMVPAKPRIPEPQTDQLEEISPIVAASPETAANLALLGDKSFLFNEQRNAFIMYAVQGRSWISMGGPVGPDEQRADLIWRFREIVDRHGGWTVFYQVHPDSIYLYLDLGLTLLKLGEEARVSLTTFSLDGSSHKGLRHTKSKAEREGCIFEIIMPDQTRLHLSELRAISDAWLGDKNTREKGFSLGFFSDEYLARSPVAIVRQNERIVAFANLWLGGGKQEVSIDLMRYLPDAPHGMMDFLFINLMQWGHDEGYNYFNLGMAPLAGFEEHPLAPLWNRVGGFIFRHGEHFYNFDGLRQYKGKFDPEWTPKYLAAPGGLALPRILANLTSLIAGGLRGAVGK